MPGAAPRIKTPPPPANSRGRGEPDRGEAARREGDAAPFASGGSDMTTLTYAGIGARATPSSVLADMAVIAGWLARTGWHLHSGGAHGADTAFAGARRPAGERCICRGADITAMPDLTATFCLRPSLTPAPISPPAIIPPGTAARRPSASCTPGTPEFCWTPACTGPSMPSFAGPAMAGPSPAARAWASGSPRPTASLC